jgi:hypothetical protein
MSIENAEQAKLEILTAADWWAREVMRSDKSLTTVEQKLFEAVIHYQRLEREAFEIPIRFPKPPLVPTNLGYEPIDETPTKRYSELPTAPIPSPSLGIKAVDIDQILDNIDELSEGNLWTGKKTGK